MLHGLAPFWLDGYSIDRASCLCVLNIFGVRGRNRTYDVYSERTDLQSVATQPTVASLTLNYTTKTCF